MQESNNMYIFEENMYKIGIYLYLFKPTCSWENKTLKITDVIVGQEEGEGENKIIMDGWGDRNE